MHRGRRTTSGRICDCQKGFSGAFLCVTQHRRGGGPTTPDVTQTCVFRLSGRLLQSQWTLRTCVPFQFYIKHPAAHADTSKVTLLSQLTLNASLCCPLLGTFSTVFIYVAVPLRGSVPALEIEVTLMNGMSLSSVNQGVQYMHVSPNIEFK